MHTLIKFAYSTCTALSMLVAASTACAQATWTGAADASPPNGVYNNAGNWSGTFGLVPGAADTAIFNANAIYTITFTGNQALAHASVRSGQMSWLSDSATVRSFTLGRLSAGGANQTLTIGSSAKPLAVTSANLIEAGTIITLGNGTIVVDGASSSLGGPGVQLGGFADLDGTLRYQNNAQGAIAGQIDLGSSTYDDSNGILEILSGADLTSGNLVLATTTSTATGTINVSGAGSTLVQTGASTLTLGGGTGGAGTINVNTDGSFTTGSGLTTVNATGTINRTGTGVFNVTGNLTLDGGKFLTSGGNFNRGAGQVLTVQSGGLFSANPSAPSAFAEAAAGATLSSSGTIQVNSGEMRIEGATAADRLFSFNSGAGGAGGTLNITGGQMTLSGTALASGGGGYGGNMITGAMTNGGIGGVGGTVTVSGGTMTLADQSALSLAGGRGGTRLGAGGQSGGDGGNGGTFQISGGSVEMYDNSSLAINGGNGGHGDTGLGEHGGNGGAGGTLQVSNGTFTMNGGTVTLLGGAGGSGGSAGSAGAPGQVIINGGMLTMNGGELTTGSLSPGGAFNFIGGKLRATTVSGKIVVGGTLAPGITTGTLTVNGGYTQGSAGTLEIELGGASAGQFDRLVTTASTTLGGALNVVVTNGFVPQAGNSFNILDLAPFTGAFATLNLPGGGLTWNTSLLYLTGTISVGGVVGDYNKNGTVDAADYVVWRKSLGQTGVGLAADGNFNNVIDAGDLTAWRSHFGQTPGSGAGTVANAAVPEPTSALLLVAGLTVLVSGRRSRGPNCLSR